MRLQVPARAGNQRRTQVSNRQGAGVQERAQARGHLLQKERYVESNFEVEFEAAVSNRFSALAEFQFRDFVRPWLGPVLKIRSVGGILFMQ